MREAMLSTSDNPYDPFTEFDKWMGYDMAQGYHTPGLLARVAKTSDTLSDADQNLAVDQAIDSIVEMDDTGVEGVHYIKVFKE